MDLSKMVDKKQEINVATQSQSWKHRIVEYLYAQPNFEASVDDLLQATDPRFTDDNKSKRVHCLASQLTYLRQDIGVETHRPSKDTIALLGVRDPKTKKVHPFAKK